MRTDPAIDLQSTGAREEVLRVLLQMFLFRFNQAVSEMLLKIEFRLRNWD